MFRISSSTGSNRRTVEASGLRSDFHEMRGEETENV